MLDIFSTIVTQHNITSLEPLSCSNHKRTSMFNRTVVMKTAKVDITNIFNFLLCYIFEILVHQKYIIKLWNLFIWFIRHSFQVNTLIVLIMKKKVSRKNQTQKRMPISKVIHQQKGGKYLSYAWLGIFIYEENGGLCWIISSLNHSFV